jgi:hypothetical protein
VPIEEEEEEEEEEETIKYCNIFSILFYKKRFIMVRRE